MRTHRPLPSQSELHALFTYDPITGILRWKKSGSGRSPDLIAGLRTSRGYMTVGINQVYYGVHRVVWKMATGIDPGSKMIDHINRNFLDNRISNLRLAEHSDNQKNKKIGTNNTSGFKGVHWVKARQRWCGAVYSNGIRKRTPDFCDLADAVEATQKLREKMHGEFTRHS